MEAPDIVYVLLCEGEYQFFQGEGAALAAVTAKKEALAAGLENVVLVEGEVL